MLFKSTEFKAEDINESKRTFAGYASTWDLDQGGDVIHKGAFKKTISERGNQVKVLWQHDQNQPIGLPISMTEDSKGLLVEAKLSNTTLGNDVIELLKDGVVNQMSIGYSIPANKSEVNSKGIRDISEVKLFEFSPVTFPMNESAIITGAKNMRDALAMGRIEQKDLQQVQELLKDLSTLLAVGEPPKKHSLLDNQPSELEQLSAVLSNFKLKL